MRYVVMAIVMALTCLNLSTAQAETTPSQRESLRELSGLVGRGDSHSRGTHSPVQRNTGPHVIRKTDDARRTLSVRASQYIQE